ncbi:LIM domain transcription factor LMO4.1-like isoform X1 [Ylistrum balloti]|uniref:LIM domain transcription factor LMO4.1-like isoform X1 n=1 Tax=Ylistrum balloti TaxID=509963 RepID=UPI002905EC02|nr:LIM domain transcription factor LMO4.1-like isoform X1 [Ylistrum balloti]
MSNAKSPHIVTKMTNGSEECSAVVNGVTMQQTGNDQTGNGSMFGNNVKACAGCGGRILDRFLLHAMDRYWHTGCLKCSCCQTKLEHLGSCFSRSGMILCKNDYIRLFGSSGSCSACGQSIPASEFVMKAQGNVYHVKCFKCVTCHNQLSTGDRFSIFNGGLLCEQDYPKVMKGHVMGSARGSHKVQGSSTLELLIRSTQSI